MDDSDVVLRNITYRMFVDAGRAPTAEAVAAATDGTVGEVREAWARLHDAHALVLQTARSTDM